MNARSLIFLALALSLAPSPAAAAAPQTAADPAAEIQALEQRLLQAVVDGDAEALGRLLAPDFEYTRATGERMTAFGAERWRQMALGAFRLEGFEIHETRVRFFGEGAALAVTRATVRPAGAGSGGQRLLTSTWLRDGDGAWRLAARISAELGGGLGALRAAGAGGAGEADGVDREALRQRWRQRLEQMDPEEREALRRRFGQLQGPSEKAAGEEPAAEEPADEEPGEDPPP